ncbi:inhibitor of growth protein 1 [Populus alba x Populus x berolinensis]|nr:inhibitor of growth protein 1 [Populus alba x Populus x berolinensis]
MRSVTSWCTACIPGRKQKETKTEESEKSLRKKPSRDESSGSSHQGTTHAASSADTGGAAVCSYDLQPICLTWKVVLMVAAAAATEVAVTVNH